MTTFDRQIAALYAECETAPPTPERAIVPLSVLARGEDRNCIELPALTARKAFDFLLSRGGLLQEPSLAQQEAAREPLAGFLWANAARGAIFVRMEDPVSRRRFSAAHELAHFVLHWPLEIEAAKCAGRADEVELTDILPLAPDDDEPESMAATNQPAPNEHEHQHAQREREADAFAAELLMPEELVREMARRIGARRDADLIWRLATDLLVSRAAMRRRLRTLGLLRDGQ